MTSFSLSETARWAATLFCIVGFVSSGCSGDDAPGGSTPATCPGSQTLCDDACYDLSSSPQACGSCSSACDPGQVCSDGVCETECGAGLVECGGACIDPLTERGFCGASNTCEGGFAGEACDDDEVCSGGSCQENCTGGTVLCDGRCADPNVDPDYCGASDDCAGNNAGTVCGGDQVCDDGACRSECGPNNIVCGGGCVDPSANPNFCGATADCADDNAGTVCASGEACVDGACEVACPDDQIVCNGVCVAPLTNPNFCGARDSCVGPEAGVACLGNQTCLGGTCFDARVLLVSPFDRAGESITPRPVRYTIDTLVPGTTVHYTVDGSEPIPGMGSTTTTTTHFQVGPLANAVEVRYVVEIDGRLSEPERLAASIQSTEERGAIVENLNINGEGPVGVAGPGDIFTVSGNIQYWKQTFSGSCPGCLIQAHVSMESIGRIACYEDLGSNRGLPGQTGTFNGSFVAPDVPGDYRIAVTNPATFGCNVAPPRGVTPGFNGGATIGLLQVRAPARTSGGN